ncbi:MAG: DUF3429 domain-containing protein [Betaproteobacteria bacterium]|nr:DUF3429 domain-containing protein [Betaproteobacteria bacterium]
MSQSLRLPHLLGLAGTFPFIAGAATLWFGPSAYAAPALQAIITYAAIILSFLGGIQWGTGVSVSETAPKSARTLFLLSVVPSLLSWAMLFLDTPAARLIVAIFLFGFVWLIDALLHLQKLIPHWFFRLRSIITPVVIASLTAALMRT